MDPDVPTVDVDTGQQQKQESCYPGGGGNLSENQDHRLHSRHHNPLPFHSPASSLSSCSPSSFVVGEGRGSGGCVPNLHCQSVRHQSFDNFSKKDKDDSICRMTPEEGQDALVVVDHQQHHRHHHQQQRVPPERPSSSCRTPCPKFSSNSQKCDSCGLEFETTNLYLEHVCESSKKYNITTDICSNTDGSRPTSTLVVPTSQPHLSGGFGALGRSPSSAAFCSSSGELSNSSASDVENFTGKIVYNPDGSAFILETGDSEELSDEDDDEHHHHVSGASSRSHHHHLVGRGSQQQHHQQQQQQQLGVMVNALHIARNPALYSALYGQAAYSFLQEKNKVPDVPVMHSFRVFTVRDKSGDTVPSKTDSSSEKRPSPDRANFPMVDYSSVPIKPILMCFLCKLSFGYAKSFVAHAMGEHTITLNEEEKTIMSEKNTSAIIQGVGKDKEPLLSFLEPIPSSASTLDTNSGGNSGSGVQQQQRGIPSSGSGFFSQPMQQQSSCSSSFGSSDPVTSLLNAVSSAMAGGCYGSSAITTLVSAISSPVAALSEIKPPPTSNAPISTSTGGGISSLLASSDNEEALAPELQDLATIEKMAKAAAAAAEADITPTLSPTRSLNGSNVTKENHNKCFNGQGEHPSGQEHRLNVFEFSQHPNLTTAVSTAISLSSLERPTSAGSHDSPSPGVRVSPKNVPVPSPSLTTVPSPSPTASSPVMVCPQHPDGRTNGVECPKCDLILGSSRSLGGHMTMMHSRNSCKTLKCPKCNWHYKYQETLEIHMKEKHPENDLSCIYCLTNQTHPRLARGETYTCGYKPYRCEVCNYSTTTKGNLSIHMQSDKHINNVQELQNGNIPSDHVMTQQSMPAPQPLATPPMADAGAKKPIPTTKPKATWRCDVCNYETNVARNLRIHMTSEKHNHNMMVLQQNVKHMQQLSAFQQAQAAQAQAIDPMFQFHPGLLMPCDSQLQPEAALADIAYNHALLMMATQQQQQRAMAAAAAAAAAATGKNSISAPLNMNVPPTLDIEHPDPSLRPDVPYDENSKLFQCCVCHIHSSDSVESLNQHAQLDRTRQREEEVLMVVAGTYICKLCTYKTNLKANFQLHCKTDKHLQRLQHVNHVKEGGTSTEWKLKYANVSNPVQVRCNACDYYTNSIHKLQMHTANPRHEANSRIFAHLQIGQNALKAEAHFFHCKLCNFSTKAKYKLIQHVNSIRHLRHENIRQMQLRNEGRLVEEDLRDYVLVKELKGNENIIFDADVDTPIIEFPDEDSIRPDSKSEPTSEERSPPDSRLKMVLLEQAKVTNCETSVSTEQQHQCPFCNYSSNSEVRIQMHVVAQHTTQPDTVSCPLCQEGCKDLNVLENHLMEIHNVIKEGVQRLLLMVDVPSSAHKKDRDEVKIQCAENSPEKQHIPDPERITSPENKTNEETGDDLACSVCGKGFVNIDDLFIHQNEAGHMELKPTPSGLGYQCWKKGCTQYFKTMLSLQMHFKEIHVKKALLAVSDRHVYKYRCNQCSLAFKTLEKLQLHSQYHMIRAATKCVLCGRSFRSVIALQKHVETTHTDMTKEQLEQYKASLANNPLLVGGSCGVLDPQTTELLKKESIRDELECIEEVVDAGTEKDDRLSPLRDMDCDHIEEPPATDGPTANQDVLEDYINSQSVAEDSYNDPNRKYKCHRCKVAFTRQSYLTSHNKTLLHRKGEKMSYPMEKYLDPNRPFKCEICMESFTQKNILLVHYNSVSHLHKVKLSMKENNNGTAASLATTTTNVTSTSSASNACIALSSQNQESEKKPYKCNICKVSYSQGSTLDIHVRSVLHQTRASKLHELAMTGQLDLSVPLIERPEQSMTENQPQQLPHAPPNLTSESSSLTLPQSSSGTATSVPSSVQAPKIPDLTKVPSSGSSSGATPTTITTTITSASPQLQLPTDAASMAKVLGLTPPVVPQSPVLSTSTATTASVTACSRCNATFNSQDMLLQHQTLCYLFNQPLQLGKNVASTNNNMNSCGSVSTHLQQQQSLPPPTPLPELTPNKAEPNKDDDSLLPSVHHSKTAVLSDLNQIQDSPANSSVSQISIRPKCPFPRPRPLVYKHLIESFGFDVVMQFNENNQKRRRLEKRDHELVTVKSENPKTGIDPSEHSELVKNEVIEEKDEGKSIILTDLPEINRSMCDVCLKEFTSIWVLKAHKEEIHKEVVPFEFLESFAECYRSEYEKRNAVDQMHAVADEANMESSTPVPPIKSEPTLCPTPSSASSSSSAQHSMSATPPTSSIPPQAPDVSSSVAANQMAAQLQFNQLLMSMGLGMSLPMGMNLNMPFAAAAAMNMHPPLIPVLLPPPMDPLMASAFNHPVMPGGVDTNFFAAQQKMLQHQQALANAQSQQKRARTRISDEQLKILRTYFDINNSPTEEQLIEMSEKSGLPLKVIKHWFRNTLFKERQRNKDSPYNFNNPPSTFLNLEEYEKTGEAKVIPINRSDFLSSKTDADSTNQSEDGRCSIVEDTDSSQEDKDKPDMEYHQHHHHLELDRKTPSSSKHDSLCSQTPTTVCSGGFPNFHGIDIPISMSSSADVCKDLQLFGSQPPSPSSQPSPSINFSSVTSITTPLVPAASSSPPTSDSPRAFSSPSFCGNPSLNVSSGSGKRANRTRFTDYQIKVLQEFFESNAYPKDDDLEYLSKLLNLSPRVIVVWFQNARQKARKVYENQPPINADEDSAGKFQRTPGLNYQCKKCLQVFQRYYELIKHQKSSCFKDENPIAVQMKAAAAIMDEKSQGSSVSEPCSIVARNPDKFGQNGTYRCDKCSLAFPRFDLWREHQIVHIMNPNLFPNYSPNSSFGILQYEAQQPPTPPLKRKLSEEEEIKDIGGEQPKDKRLRTTILPEQLDYLYQKYQIESNPSRKMLENIAREVGLKKRVVQVWFQNTRARERKGQFRAHQQVIHKRCPFCRALFKARSALESHLATRHADQYTRGDINIDSLPDGDIDSNPGTPSTSNASEDVRNSLFPPFSSVSTTASMSNPIFPSHAPDPVQNSMKKYYEDSLKKYLDELTATATTSVSKESTIHPDINAKTVKSPGSEKGSGQSGGDAPLDLSKPVKICIETEKVHDCLPTNLSDKSIEESMNRSIISTEDARSETHSESTDNMDIEDASHESNPTSPSNSAHRSSSAGGKRFRTQMSTVQLKIMKSIFSDYKTPSMAECENLGREIGLPKRVVQVWFQNARAKEKKAKLAFLKTFGHEMEGPKPPEECLVCKMKYNVKFSNTSMQDHLFSKRHLDNMKAHITSMKKMTDGQDNLIDAHDQSSSTPSNLLNQLSQSQQQQPNLSILDDQDRAGSLIPTTTTPSLMQQLQMMGQLQQMSGIPVPGLNLPGFPPNVLPGSNGSGNSATPTVRSPPSSTSSVSPNHSAACKEDKALLSVDKVSNNNPVSGNKNSSGESNVSSHPQTPFAPNSSNAVNRKDDKKDQQEVVNGGNPTTSSTPNPHQRPGNVTDFPIPTSDAAGLFPYMYAGFPGYYAGLPGAFFHPGVYPGSPQSGLFYDSNLYSTPLSLLQLPPTALPEVTQKLTQPGNTTARFSQDGKTLEDLKGVVSTTDYQQAAEAEVDVGYVCKKCQLVHPAEVLCLNHQRTSCFSNNINKTGPNDVKAVLRLVQVQLECRACRERFPTILDFKFHCNAERHVKRVQKLQKSEINQSTVVAVSTTTTQRMLPPMASQAGMFSASHFAATPVAPTSMTPRMAPPPLLLPQTPQSIATGNDVTRNGPDVTARHLLFSSGMPHDFRNDLDGALSLGLEASPLDHPATSKSGICFTGEASLSPETKRLQ